MHVNTAKSESDSPTRKVIVKKHVSFGFCGTDDEQPWNGDRKPSHWPWNIKTSKVCNPRFEHLFVNYKSLFSSLVALSFQFFFHSLFPLSSLFFLSFLPLVFWCFVFTFFTLFLFLFPCLILSYCRTSSLHISLLLILFVLAFSSFVCVSRFTSLSFILFYSFVCFPWSLLHHFTFFCH